MGAKKASDEVTFDCRVGPMIKANTLKTELSYDMSGFRLDS